MSRTSSSYAHARLPRAGLGNMLLVWARAWVFAHLNELPLHVSGWGNLHLGPLFRGEREKRLYRDYFKTRPRGGVRRALAAWTHRRVVEPEIGRLLTWEADSRCLYVFERLPHWADYFKDLKGHRDVVRAALVEMVADKYREQLSVCRPSVIGIHVRCGDFRRLERGEDFAKTGHARAPLGYFVGLIECLRKLHGAELPVTVFSDGHDEELGELLSVPGVRRAGRNAAIVDLLLLAGSKIIVPSPGSTFGYWAAFLSDAVVLHHPDHMHEPLRPEEVNRRFFEGSAAAACEAAPALLRSNIEDITLPLGSVPLTPQ